MVAVDSCPGQIMLEVEVAVLVAALLLRVFQSPSARLKEARLLISALQPAMEFWTSPVLERVPACRN